MQLGVGELGIESGSHDFRSCGLSLILMGKVRSWWQSKGMEDNLLKLTRKSLVGQKQEPPG